MGYMRNLEIIRIGDRIIMLILAYSRMMVLGKISPNSRMMIAMGITIIWGEIISTLSKYMVAKEVVRILEKLVPMRMMAKYSSLFSRIDAAHFERRIFCLSHTLICSEFAEMSAISDPEKMIDKINPAMAKFRSSITIKIPHSEIN